MTATLIVGFDSAWTPRNAGAIVGVLTDERGCYTLLGKPEAANFEAATNKIREWQRAHSPVRTLIFIDQPIIVKEPTGQRPVEKIVGSPVGRRYGGVQPANRSRSEMFGEHAPIWEFLETFGGPCDPRHGKLSGDCVIETYPVLGLIALGWLRDDDHEKPRSTGCLPKYNPENKKKFRPADWDFVSGKVWDAFYARQLHELAAWAGQVRQKSQPAKSDQDCLDACLCLLAGLHMAEGKDCLFVGHMVSGYMVVPYGEVLCRELHERKGYVERKKASFSATEVARFNLA